MPLPHKGEHWIRIRSSTIASTLVCAMVGVSLAAPARAHEYWLTPAHYRAAAGELNSASAFVGTGFRGEPKPYAATRSVRFVLAAARTVDLGTAAVNGDLTWASFEMPDADGALVAYQSNFAIIELPAQEFDDYLKLEGLTEPLAARARLGEAAGPGRERYARCPKTWIAGARRERAMKPVGLPLEIVPLADPGSASPLPVRVLWRGRPLAGALVRAWNSPLDSAWTPRDAATRDSVGPSIEAVTDARGEARLTLARAGEWLVSSVHMVPCAERNEADWESWWASFTFARAANRR
jgi:uncharacterized GH25 family protein